LSLSDVFCFTQPCILQGKNGSYDILKWLSGVSLFAKSTHLRWNGNFIFQVLVIHSSVTFVFCCHLCTYLKTRDTFCVVKSLWHPYRALMLPLSTGNFGMYWNIKIIKQSLSLNPDDQIIQLFFHKRRLPNVVLTFL